MSEKHYPCIGGGFDKIIFDGDNSVWVPECENAKLKAENEKLKTECYRWHFEARRAQYDWGESFKQSYRRKNEIADLKAENDKLRNELNAEHALAETLGHFHEAAKAENEKLRLLVRGLDYCSDELNSAECERCPLYDPADSILEPKCVRMMREMGIEMREIEIDKGEI